MARLFALAALLFAPLAVLTTGVATGSTTTPTTGAATDTSGTSGTVSATTDTMPPVYEPCGCSSAGEGGGLAVLALLFTVGSPSRRRRPTSRPPCFRGP